MAKEIKQRCCYNCRYCDLETTGCLKTVNGRRLFPSYKRTIAELKLMGCSDWKTKKKHLIFGDCFEATFEGSRQTFFYLGKVKGMRLIYQIINTGGRYILVYDEWAKQNKAKLVNTGQNRYVCKKLKQTFLEEHNA